MKDEEVYCTLYSLLRNYPTLDNIAKDSELRFGPTRRKTTSPCSGIHLPPSRHRQQFSAVTVSLKSRLFKAFLKKLKNLKFGI